MSILCPEGPQLDNDTLTKGEDETLSKKCKQVPVEGSGSLELSSYKNPKTWKKSITNFFRNQLRSTRSNDGDRPSDTQNHFEDKEMSPDQKWQSLGKIFRRQSIGEQWKNSPSQQGESSHTKRLVVRKVLSSYFGKTQKSLSVVNDK